MPSSLDLALAAHRRKLSHHSHFLSLACSTTATAGPTATTPTLMSLEKQPAATTGGTGFQQRQPPRAAGRSGSPSVIARKSMLLALFSFVCSFGVGNCICFLRKPLDPGIILLKNIKNYYFLLIIFIKIIFLLYQEFFLLIFIHIF
jgi:hypothetical protein